MYRQCSGAVKAFSSGHNSEVPADLPLAVNKQSTFLRWMCFACLKKKKKKKANGSIKFLLSASFSASLVRLPAISHRHQAPWWSAPCVLMSGVHERLRSNTSSLAVTSSELWNHCYSERSPVFSSPCMDGPVHAALPNPAEGTVQIYTRLSTKQKGHFLTGNTCIFAKSLIFLCK